MYLDAPHVLDLEYHFFDVQHRINSKLSKILRILPDSSLITTLSLKIKLFQNVYEGCHQVALISEMLSQVK